MDGKINEIYTGLDPDDHKQYEVDEKIQVLNRQIGLVDTYYKQLTSGGDRDGNTLLNSDWDEQRNQRSIETWSKKIQKLNDIKSEMPEKLDKAV